MNEDEKHSVDPSEIHDLAEKESKEKTLVILIGICIGSVLLLIYSNGKSMYEVWTDQSISFVMCPRDFTTDAPILMKTINQTDILQADNYVRSFIFRYIRSRYPRVTSDTESFYRYVRGHSLGNIYVDFDDRLEDLKNVNRLISSNNYVKFYPHSSDSVRIRKVSTGEWNVEVDGYMHKRGKKIEKTQPTIELTVIKGKHTRDNPEGLYIKAYNVHFIKDPVSREKISL